MLDSIIKEAVEVFKDEQREGYLDDFDSVQIFGYESADLYISKLSTSEEWELLEELNRIEPVADFGLAQEDVTLGQAITTYVQSTLGSLIVRATINAYYEEVE